MEGYVQGNLQRHAQGSTQINLAYGQDCVASTGIVLHKTVITMHFYSKWGCKALDNRLILYLALSYAYPQVESRRIDKEKEEENLPRHHEVR